MRLAYRQQKHNTAAQSQGACVQCIPHIVKFTAKAPACHQRSVLAAAAATSLTETPGFWAQTNHTETRSTVGTAGPTEAFLLVSALTRKTYITASCCQWWQAQTGVMLAAHDQAAADSITTGTPQSRPHHTFLTCPRTSSPQTVCWATATASHCQLQPTEALHPTPLRPHQHHHTIVWNSAA